MEPKKYLRSEKRMYISYDKKMYMTTVHSVDEDAIYIVTPMKNGSVVHINAGQTIEVGFWEPNGIFSFKAVIEANVSYGQKGLFQIVPISSFKRMQRRDSYRIYINCRVIIEVVDGETGKVKKPIETHSLNISIGGMCIKLNEELDKDVEVICRVALDEFGDYISTGLTVFSKRINSAEKAFAVGVQFVNCEPSDQRKLSRFIRSREIMTRRK